jgi:cytochrome c biogenesis protein CcdA
MDILLSYLAGILTLFNPCVLPILPIVLATALQASPLGPAVLAVGMSISFVAVGMSAITLGHVLGLCSQSIAQFGSFLMIVFGLIILFPFLSTKFSMLIAGAANRADQKFDCLNLHTLAGQFIGGLLLGAVWSPCVGPTLGGAIALASQGENLMRSTLIMFGYACGVASLVIAMSYLARNLLARRREKLQKLVKLSQPIIGVTFVFVGIMLFFGLNHQIEEWALDNMPEWLILMSVAI